MALSTRICDELHGRDQMSLSSAFLPKPLCRFGYQSGHLYWQVHRPLALPNVIDAIAPC